MTIQELHIQSNGFRDLINYHKRQIAALDEQVRANEIEIARLMDDGKPDEDYAEIVTDCTLCMGQCNTDEVYRNPHD